MLEIAKVEMSLIDDRGFKKVMVNVIEKDKISGFIRPL
jgi:hypothetical protein